jgi:hypothetical protein
VGLVKLLVLAILVFALNVPFGYWRANTRKFSLEWVLAVHLSVPFVIALRLGSGLGFALYTYPVLVGAFFLGQFAGGRLRGWMSVPARRRVTSCLVMDVVRAMVG